MRAEGHDRSRHPERGCTGAAHLDHVGAADGRVYYDDGKSAARERVAGRGITMIDPCDTIAVDAGPTPHALAMALPEDFRGSVITHSVPVLHLLDERLSAVRTVALGGELLADRHAFVGPTTEAAVTELRARTFFFSPTAVDARGTYARSSAEASVQRS